MTQETMIRITGDAASVTITASNAYPIRGELKARGYAFVTDDGAMPVWALTIPRSAMASVVAEAAWIKATGLTVTR